MRFSIEARTPFADDVDLIEYVFQIPAVYKIYDGWSKYLLRESMTGVLPEKIRLRKDKIGFATPEWHWLNEMKTEFRGYLGKELSDILDVKGIQRDWEKLLRTPPKSGVTNLWRFINLAVWRKVYGL